jgi:cytosine/adenosine deaminase-related metal-dependent hydrolase
MIIHTAPWVLPISRPPIADGAVAVDERGVIRGLGRREDLRGGNFVVGRVIEHAGVLMPGLVNAHAHLELSDSVPGGDGLAPWIGRLLATRRPPDVPAISAAVAQIFARGTVAVADVCNSGLSSPLARAAGLEVLELDERLGLGGELAAPRAGAVMTAHSTYTCGESSLRQIAAHANGHLASIHLEEDPAEAGLTVEGAGPLAELLRARGAPVKAVGLRPLAWLDSLGLIGDGTLLVHLTFADDASLRRAAELRAVAVLCPRSNQHITAHLPPFARIRAAGGRVALGTDSLASSPSLDLFGDVQALARAGADPAWLLEIATSGGAVALHKPHLGALEPGRRPGLIAVAANTRDPISFVAHEAADAPVERVA